MDKETIASIIGDLYIRLYVAERKNADLSRELEELRKLVSMEKING